MDSLRNEISVKQPGVYKTPMEILSFSWQGTV